MNPRRRGSHSRCYALCVVACLFAANKVDSKTSARKTSFVPHENHIIFSFPRGQRQCNKNQEERRKRCDQAGFAAREAHILDIAATSLSIRVIKRANQISCFLPCAAAAEGRLWPLPPRQHPARRCEDVPQPTLPGAQNGEIGGFPLCSSSAPPAAPPSGGSKASRVGHDGHSAHRRCALQGASAFSAAGAVRTK